MKKRTKRVILLLLLLLIVICWGLLENKILSVSEYFYESRELPAEFDGYRIVQISDLHNASFGKDNGRLLEKIEELAPDVVVLTGDLVDSGHTDIEVAVAFAEDLAAKYLTYYVTGNHEPQYLQAYSKYPVDLVFSGHAHGGQVRIPFVGGIIAPGQGLFPQYTAGLHEENGSTMVVSRGLGNSVVPIRFFNLPEIVCVELHRIP